MEIIVLTIGTRGDVQPFVALCKGLKRAGHRPRIASHGCFKAWVEGEGIAFKDIGSERINQPDEWLTAKNIKDFFMAMKPEMVKSKLACEAFYKDGLWVPAKVLGATPKGAKLDVRYDKPEPPIDCRSIPRCTRQPSVR